MKRFNLRLSETELEVLGEMTSSFPVRSSSFTDASVSLIRSDIRMKIQKLFYSPVEEVDVDINVDYIDISEEINESELRELREAAELYDNVYPYLVSSGYFDTHEE